MARPTIYNETLANKICERLAGGESLNSICQDEDMPNRSTVLLWVVTTGHPFSDKYMQAREAAGFAHADTVADLHQKVLDGVHDPKAAQVAIGALQWAAERMAPKKHSPRQQLDHSSSDGSMTPARGRNLDDFYREAGGNPDVPTES